MVLSGIFSLGRIPKGIAIVWETYHYWAPMPLGVPGITLEKIGKDSDV